MRPNVSASLRDRLLARARAEGTEFEFVLTRYACERFLYRLGASPARDRWVLKGATLLGLWMQEPFRATRDIDLLAIGPNDEAEIRALIREVCDVPCEEDGIAFDLSSLAIAEIMEGQPYRGIRARFDARLGSARLRVQLDFGFGDVVVPGPEEQQLPTLVEGLPAPRVRAYPKATTVAEKFEAMVKLGEANSRMKDFHDVWALSETFAFDGQELHEAVVRCFARRGTEWLADTPAALKSAFYTDAARQARWAAHGKDGGLLQAPPADFGVVGTRIQEFFGPLRQSCMEGVAFSMVWSRGGPWGTSQQ